MGEDRQKIYKIRRWIAHFRVGFINSLNKLNIKQAPICLLFIPKYRYLISLLYIIKNYCFLKT